jgi:ABC-type bacteriocin/lantibiotic exporter with double-glycine peptidase domain
MEYLEKNSFSISKIYDFIKGNRVLIADEEYQRFAYKKVERILKQVQKIEFRLQYFFELIFSTLGSFIQPCVNVLIIVILGRKVIDGECAFGTFILVLTFFNLLQSKLDCFQNISDLFFHTKGALDVLMRFIYGKTSDRNEVNVLEKKYFLDLENVCLRLGDEIVFNDVSLHLENNNNYGVTGVSGTGKSCLINLVFGFINPDNGIITFLNERQKCFDYFVSRKFAFLSQSAEVFNISLQENIFLSDVWDENEFNCLVEKFEMSKLLNRNMGTDGSCISGGEKQRVLLARFVHQLKERDYYILDEPFTGLDILTKKRMINIIKPFLKNKTGICITHDQLVLDELCNEILVLNKNHKIQMVQDGEKIIENILKKE